MRNSAAVLVLALALSGCNPAYQRPSGSDIARIRFVPAQETGYYYSMSAYVHKSDECGTPNKIFGLGGGPFNFGGGKKDASDLGMPKAPSTSYTQGQYYETAIKGGERFFFSVTGGQRAGVCYLTGSFEPEAGGDYEVTYASDQRSCRLRLSKLTVDDGRVIAAPVPTIKQRASACTSFWN
jgi:hypothetical protein